MRDPRKDPRPGDRLVKGVERLIQSAADLRLAARCVASLAKLEGSKKGSRSRWWFDPHSRDKLRCGVSGYETALEAIESATPPKG